MWPLFLLHQVIHTQCGAALIHHFDLHSIRAAPETVWKLKFAVGAIRDAIFKKHGSVVGCPPSFRCTDVLQQQRYLWGHFLASSFARSVSL